ncbi:hypothetical protein CHS0354_018271 [Potamilus streckersoni]|uniref:Rho GTPase-activating protein 20 n=1 Tax=Potamilus streckersoni TaxID=2493646 RepID=A0AAE0SJL9_9BIVA|nr:hypothetical protein CHS0354_018271 [Potamilus streckersoni]
MKNIRENPKVQRIPEYDKYLNDLLEKTDPSHSDYEDLKKAATKVRNMVREHEEEMVNMDNEKQMERVQEKFPYDDLQLCDLDSSQRKQLASRRKSAPGAVLFKSLSAKSKSTGNLLAASQMGKKENEIFRPGRSYNLQRQYLMEGHVEFATGMQTQDRYMFLFSDLLLVAKQKSNTTFKLKQRIRVRELWISSCIDDVAEITRPPDRSFVLGWPTTNVVATFRSVELKDTWLNKFKEQIEAEKRKEMMPKEISLEILYKDIGQACTLSVDNNTAAREIIKQCLVELQITDSETKDYQLWVKGEKDEYQYPLIGHELLYSIMLSHISDLAKANEEETLSGKEIQKMIEENQGNRKLEFILKHTKKSPKKASHEDVESHQKLKKKGKSPLFNIFRRPREEKKPQGKLFGHNLQDITTPENLIPKPVMDLMTILFREGPHTVGILRKSPNAKLLKELRDKMDNGDECLNDSCPPLVVGGLLKEFLRSIPQSLMYEDLFEDWITVHSLKDGQEKQNKMKLILEKLPACHFALLKHLLCVLFYIDKKSDENKMTAYNLSVCIAPSLLWAKGNPDPLATPAALIQCMIQNFIYIFGEESLNLFGEPVEQKARQDSSTDSDSMHSVLSTHSGMRRDDSSIDSLEREIHYSGDMDSSPKLNYSHLSPSNLSRDSGLMLSDTMLYDEEHNSNNVDRREYSRSASHYIERDIDIGEHNEVSHSLDSNFFYYEGQIPVPPPRKSRKKGSELLHQSSNFDPYGRHNRGTSQPQQYNGMGHSEKSRSLYSQSMSSDAFSQLCKQRSTESLKSVEEGSEMESESNVRDWGQKRSDMGTLIKSDSGAHLFMDAESLYPFSSHSHPQKSSRAHLARSAIIESTPPISPDSKYSLNSSHDSVLSDSSGSYVRQFSNDLVFSSPPHTPESDCDVPSWIAQKSKDIEIEGYAKRQYSQDDSEVGLKSGDFTHKFEGHAADHDSHHTSPSPVSPKAGPVTSAISHSPLGVRHSFPLETSTTHVGSGSNTSKEAEDIIRSPKISVTYCSVDSLSKLDDGEHLKKPGSRSPNLDLYNSSPSSGSHLPLKSLKYMGRLGTSPPPRVVLHGLKQTSERKENMPVRASYDNAIISQVRQSNFDVTELRERTPSKVESLSSDSVSLEESDSEEENVRYTSMLSLSLRPKSPPKIIDEPVLKSTPKQFESPSKRPEQPPSYNEAVERNFFIKQGVIIDKFSPLITNVDGMKQKEASAKALQLYQQSLQKYQEQVTDKKFGPPSQQFEIKLDAVGEKADENLETEGVRDSDYVSLVQPEKDPKKLYQQSLEQYIQQQHSSQSVRTTQPVALAHVSSLLEEQSTTLPQSAERINKDLLDVVCIQRSLSDVGNHVNKRDSWLRQKSPSREPSPADSGRSVSPSVSISGVVTTDSYGSRHPPNSDGSEDSLMKRPDQPPPYLDPPSYKREIVDSSPRHTFRTVDGKPHIVGNSHRSLTARSLENLSQKFSTLTHKRESFEDEPFFNKSVISSSSVRNSSQRVSDSSRESSVDVSSRDSSRSVTPQRDLTPNSRQKDSWTLTTNRDSPNFINSKDSPQTVAGSQESSLSQSPSLDSLSFDSSRPHASSLEPSVKQISTKDVVSGSVNKKNITMSQRDSPLEARLRRSSVDSLDSRTSVNSKNVDSSNNSSQNPGSRNASPSTTKSMSAKELPWSVKQLRSQFDTSKTSSAGTDPQDEAASNKNSTTAPSYNNPPLFPGKNDNLRASSSSLSSIGSAKTNHNVTFKKTFGPQAWDSFSSTDESDSSHHSFYHRRDTSSSSEYEEWSYTDISYV